MPTTLICEQCGKEFQATNSHAKRGQRFCSRECYHAFRPKREQARFWSYVDKAGPNGCWIWTGGHTGSGYGQFIPPACAIILHRYAYEMVHGPIPTVSFCHHCDNRQCVNPERLFLGSAVTTCRTPPPRAGPCRASITRTHDSPRERKRCGDCTLRLQGQIAKRFGTTQAHVQPS